MAVKIVFFFLIIPSRYILYEPNISSVHVKCGLMSLKVRLDIASHSISLITIDLYRAYG